MRFFCCRRDAAEQVDRARPAPAAPRRRCASSSSPVSTPSTGRPSSRADVARHQLVVAGQHLDRRRRSRQAPRSRRRRSPCGGSRKAAKPAKTSSPRRRRRRWRGRGPTSGRRRRARGSPARPALEARQQLARAASSSGRRVAVACLVARRSRREHVLGRALRRPAGAAPPLSTSTETRRRSKSNGTSSILRQPRDVELAVGEDRLVQRAVEAGLEVAVEVGRASSTRSLSCPAASTWRVQRGCAPRSACRSCRCTARPCRRGRGSRPGA